jgi:large conductance mechanosensitive channel
MDNSEQNISKKKRLMQKASKMKEKVPTKQVGDFWSDFRDFAFKGNIIELAVGVVIGTAFNNLVQSLVTNIIMPPIGKLLGNTSFTNLFIDLSGNNYETLLQATTAGAPVIKYGLFISNMIDFLIMALTIFIVIRFVLRVKKEEKS